MGLPYNRNAEVATVLAQICCFENKIPQGAPSSPIVSNMICAKMDSQLSRLARLNRCRYTRYADDLSFSTSVKDFPEEIALQITGPAGPRIAAGNELSRIIAANGFKVNLKKVRLQRSDRRQVVTGLVTNRKPNVTKEFRNRVRAMLHAWEIYGLKKAEDEYHSKKYYVRHCHPDRERQSFEQVVKGKVSFIGQVKGKADATYLKFCGQLGALAPGLIRDAVAITSHETIKNALWVLEDDQLCRQGTAFKLKGYGLITCHHVLAPQTVAFQRETPNQRYPVRVKMENRAIDLAIIEIDANVGTELISASSKARKGDGITLHGFPNYTLGVEEQSVPGVVVGFSTVAAIRRFNVSAAIVRGTSGGPVLNSSNKVVGVACMGGDSYEGCLREESAVIPIDALAILKSSLLGLGDETEITPTPKVL
jgi:hypothetical protein